MWVGFRVRWSLSLGQMENLAMSLRLYADAWGSGSAVTRGALGTKTTSRRDGHPQSQPESRPGPNGPNGGPPQSTVVPIPSQVIHPSDPSSVPSQSIRTSFTVTSSIHAALHGLLHSGGYASFWWWFRWCSVVLIIQKPIGPRPAIPPSPLPSACCTCTPT